MTGLKVILGSLSLVMVIADPAVTVAAPPPGTGWVPIPELTDEFDGDRLDAGKWHDHNPTWAGRQPGWFSPGNVAVRDGQLHLTARAEDLPGLPEGYHTFTTAAVKGKALVKYGYFEIKCRPMKSGASSAFWFYDHTKDWWTEIDVFEICGVGEKWHDTYHMNLHVFRTPQEEKHWARPGTWKAPFRFADGFHVYALEWDEKVIRWHVDGEVVHQAENTHWHQPLHLNFDSETMPEWFGLPDKKDLPSTFSIEYVRSWRRVEEPERQKAATGYDVEAVPRDLEVPGAVDGEPAPGLRVRQIHDGFAGSGIYHLLYLPTDWVKGGKYPVIVEYGGNKWKTSEGIVEESDLGYGISGGKGVIWVCVPYVDLKTRRNAPTWWGDVEATVDYCKKTVRRVCAEYGGDPSAVFVAGFSRGSIACNFIGLHDDEIAGLWRGFICHSHYDGVNEKWGYAGCDRKSAAERLKRLAGRPQFISQEKSVDATRDYLAQACPDGDFTFVAMGFGEHTDTWALRDVPERRAVRDWLDRVVKEQRR